MEVISVKGIGVDVYSAYHKKLAESFRQYIDKKSKQYGDNNWYVHFLKIMYDDMKEKSNLTESSIDLEMRCVAYPSLFDALSMLRKFGIFIDITTRIVDNADKDIFFSYRIQQTRPNNKPVWDTSDGEYDSWEEAAESAIEFASKNMLWKFCTKQAR